MRPISNGQERQLTVGIDIGSSKICCAIGSIMPGSDRVKLLGISSMPSMGFRKGSISSASPLAVEKGSRDPTGDGAPERAATDPLGFHLDVLMNVCDAVHFAHSRGIVHRDDFQIVLVDTPGLHRPRTLLGQRLNDLVKDRLSRAKKDR